jgi:hypothetical protein
MPTELLLHSPSMVASFPPDDAASLSTPTWSPRASSFFPVLVIAVAVALAYWPLLLGQIVLHRDSALWVFPARWFVRQALLSGQSAAWNPYQGLGFPVLADPQYALFYPPHWLLLLVPDGLVAHLATWLSFSHLVWGGLGMALLARKLGAASFGATVAGLTWALSGHTTSAWMIGPLLLGHAWIPWVARGFLALARKEGRQPLASAVWPKAMSLLVGELFVSAMAALFAAVVVLAAAKEIRFAPSFFATAARAGAAWLIAVTIAAVSWLPPVLLLRNTERAQPFDRVAGELYSHHPLRALEMVAPGALGDPTGEYPAGRWVGEPAAGGAPLFFSSYLGVASVALPLIGLRRRRLQIVLAGFSVLALFVAFGRYTPVHQLWRAVLFPFAHMHSPEKYVVLVVAALAPLSGLGASHLLAIDDRPGLRRLLLFGLGLAMLSVVASVFLPLPLVSAARTAGLRGAITLVLLIGALKLLRRRPRAASAAIVALIVMDLGTRSEHLTGFGSAKLLTHVPPAATSILEDSGVSPVPPRVYREPNLEEAAAPLGPTATWQDSQERAFLALTPNTLNVFGLAVVPGYASAIPDLLSQLGPRTFADLGRLLRLLSVSYAFVTNESANELGNTTAVTTLSRPLPNGSVLRLGRVQPRVYLPRQVQNLSPHEAILHLLDESVVSGRQVLLLTAAATSSTPTGEVAEPEPCTLESYSNTRILASCSPRSATVAVFVEQFAPGWSARVDGKPAPVLRANLLLRAVPLTAGSHRLELEYHTPGFRLALFLSAMGLLLYLAILIGRHTQDAQGKED